MDGWIKSYRSMMDNPIVCKDADHYAVWGYILHYAEHAPVDAVFNGRRITLQPGQLITGRRQISLKFKIDESKVYRILKSLKIEQQIEQQTSNACSLISVVNWGKYQAGEQQDEQPMNNDRTTTEQPVNTIQEDKNIRNIRNNKRERGEPSDLKTSDRKEKSCAKKEKSEAFVRFERWITDNAPNVGRMKEPFTQSQFEQLKIDFDLDVIQDLLLAMHNYRPLLTKNTSANLTFRRWAKKHDNEPTTKTGRGPASDLTNDEIDRRCAERVARRLATDQSGKVGW